MKRSSDSPIVVLASRLLTPFIQLFALYIIFHGHYGPGGGFQGGAILAASILLMRLSIGTPIAQLQFKSSWSTPVAALGVFIFAGTGLLTLWMGGQYLDYHFLPLVGLEDAARRSIGILLVEAGVALGVMGTLISIFDDLMEDPEG